MYVYSTIKDTIGSSRVNVMDCYKIDYVTFTLPKRTYIVIDIKHGKLLVYVHSTIK